MKKKTIAIVLMLIMIITAMMPLNVYGLNKDYIGHWAESTIQSWLDNNYISGYPDGLFKPDKPVTRVEFIKMANNLLGFTETAIINFTDVSSNDWYYQEVQKAYKAGYIIGISEFLFAPNTNLTREQATVIVSKIIGLKLNSEYAQAFTDSNLISDWAKDYVNAAVVAQIILGYSEDNTFRPQSPITRAEAIVLLDRLNQFEIKDVQVPEGTITPPPTTGGGGGGGAPGPVDPTPTAPVSITWTEPTGNKTVGDKQDITINIKLYEGATPVENVDLIMLWEKKDDSDSTWKPVNTEDISVIYNTSPVEINNGICQLIKGMTVDKDTNKSITTEVSFNKVGEYKLTVYCIKE